MSSALILFTLLLILSRFLGSVGAGFAPEFETLTAEVKQQADFNPGSCQIVDQLQLMSRNECPYSLVLNEDCPLNEHIG